MNKTVLITGACINTGVAIVEKFASENWCVVFTGRNAEKVKAAQKNYREKFPETKIIGIPVMPLTDKGTVDEEGIKKMFQFLDEQGIFVSSVVLNAADQGLGIKIFENDFTAFVKVINTNVCWNYLIVEQAALRMKERCEGGKYRIYKFEHVLSCNSRSNSL